MKSLADLLGVDIAKDATPAPSDIRVLEDISDPKEFALAVLNSREFRAYIVLGLVLGNLPGFTSILGRIMDLAGWNSPTRVEHTGKDGHPIESITEVRRVIIRVNAQQQSEIDDDDTPVTTH